ncbi:MAG TPA: trypsin-like peptidase domain-containing protein [Nocardioides sp.]|jgi:putative serine protease PepD|uniref:S1C family serine protease n=1 Tax=Nocardioides sp. TaxID=35761 RepID=UPI002E2FBD80|nr:trypsin-like peptidase domain-containing protein [Nocardioides sp.]HEX3932264.1 trypsin-like peptidase domain-containing protein [Nocardioides sp.]
MQNDPDGHEPESREGWGQEPPAPPLTWTPYGYAAQSEDGRSTLGQDVSEPVARPRSGLRGKRLAATLVAASLLVGGGAGLGGAAIWTSTHHDPQSSTVLTQTGSRVAQTAATGSIVKVAQSVLPSVVMIDVSGPSGSGSGSGIILSQDGKILTNNHVVALAGKSGDITIAFNDGSHADARVLGTDPLTDTAVVQAQGVHDLTPATLGHSSSLEVGQGVVAIGSPFGLDATVTSGIVSALNRPVNVGQVSQNNSTVYPAIQTDAAINPGNSGGPLVNLSGQVVGIDAAIQTATDGTGQGEPGSIGLGFAIPIDEVLPIVREMIKGQTPTHARLGIGVEDASAGGQSAAITDGAKISQVTNGSAAANAGLRSGDVITKIDDHLITSSDSLVAIVRSYRPGDKVTVTYSRGASTHTVRVTLDSDAPTQNS